MERTYNLVQSGEIFARTDDKKRAIAKARKAAAENQSDVVIEERRITMLIRPNGTVRTDQSGEIFAADEAVP